MSILRWLFGFAERRRMRALRATAAAPNGLYGHEVAHFANIGRGSVYTVLQRLVDDGLVREDHEVAGHFLPRARHFVTDAGMRLVLEDRRGEHG